MRVIIAGGRYFVNYKLLRETLDKLFKGKKITIISGACNTGMLVFNRPDGTAVCGADGLGERYAEERGLECECYPANWSLHGRSAGFKRNEYMAKEVKADALVAFWDGESRGTGHMIDLAKKYGLRGKVVTYTK